MQSSNAETPQSEGKLSPRGFAVKEIGEPAYLGSKENMTAENAEFSFTVDNISLDATCPNNAGAVVNGRPVQLDISVVTRDFGSEFQAEAATMFAHNNWKWLRADGTTEGVGQQPTEGNLAYYCDRASFLDPMAPNSKYNGSIWLDIPQDATELMLTSFNGGWEWELPT